MSLFSATDIDIDKENHKDYLKRIKYKEIVTKKAGSFSDIVGNDLKKNVQYRIVTSNSFNAISVLEYVSQTEQIEEIYIAVYRMNLKSVDYLKRMADDTGIKLVIILSTFFRENKKYERWCEELMKYVESNDSSKVEYAWNHAKVFLAKTKSGKHIVFEGSGNLSDNARIEQYIIEDNKAVFDFHKEWIMDLF